MSDILRVLIVEDSEDDTLMLIRELRKGGFELDYERVQDAKKMQDALNNKEWDIIISDYVMPQFSGLEALKIFKDHNIDIPFIIVSGNIGEDIAVEAMRSGAQDYILKGNYARLVPAIKRELEEAFHRKEKLNAEKGLIRSEDRNRAILDAIPDIMLRLSKNGIVLDFKDDESTRFVEFSKDIINKNITEIMPRYLAHSIRESIRKTISNGKTFNEFKVNFPNETRDYEARYVTSSENEVLAIIRDITNRKRIESEIRERNTLLQLVMDNIPQYIFWKDTNYKYLGCNKNFAKHAGLSSSKDIIGKTDAELNWQPGEAEVFNSLDKKAVESAKPILHVEMIRNINDKESWMDVSKIPMSDADGKIIGVLGVCDDVTKRRQAEAEIRERKTRELQIQTDAEKAKREFYRGTIFSVTDGKLNLVSYEEITNLITSDAKFINLVDSKDLSRLRSEIASICDIAGLIPEHKHELITAAGEAAANAVKHGKGGIAKVGLKQERVQVFIQDKGTGMDAIILPKATLMSRFSTKPSMGMGFSIMLALVDTIYLATESKGTWILLEKALKTSDFGITLEALIDNW